MINALLAAMVSVLVVVACLLVAVLVLLCRLLSDADARRTSRRMRTNDLRRNDSMWEKRR